MTLALHVDQVLATGMLGASSGATALGCDRYTSPLTLWKKLRGMPVNDDKPEAVEEAGEWGHLLEPVVRAKYALKTNSTVLVPEKSFVIFDFLRATPDGFAIRNETTGDAGTHVWTGDDAQRMQLHRALEEGRGGLVQCKTASAYKREEWEAGVPLEHEIQERVEMAVTDMPWADVVCLVGGQKFFGPIRITRDEALEDRILTDLTEFWRMVKEGIEPTPDHTDAWREHVGERLAKIRRVEIVADAELRSDVAAWRRARAAVKDAKLEEAELKTKLMLRMSNAGATIIRLDRETIVTAYQCGLKPKWRDYAISLGGERKPPPQFMGTKNTWTLRAPDAEDHETENTDENQEST